MNESESTASVIANYQRRAAVAANAVVALVLLMGVLVGAWYVSDRAVRRQSEDDRAQLQRELDETRASADEAIQELSAQNELLANQLGKYKLGIQKLQQVHETKVKELQTSLQKALAEKAALERQTAALKVARLVDPRPLPAGTRTTVVDTVVKRPGRPQP